MRWILISCRLYQQTATYCILYFAKQPPVSSSPRSSASPACTEEQFDECDQSCLRADIQSVLIQKKSVTDHWPAKTHIPHWQRYQTSNSGLYYCIKTQKHTRYRHPAFVLEDETYCCPCNLHLSSTYCTYTTLEFYAYL